MLRCMSSEQLQLLLGGSGYRRGLGDARGGLQSWALMLLRCSLVQLGQLPMEGGFQLLLGALKIQHKGQGKERKQKTCCESLVDECGLSNTDASLNPLWGPTQIPHHHPINIEEPSVCFTPGPKNSERGGSGIMHTMTIWVAKALPSQGGRSWHPENQLGGTNY